MPLRVVGELDPPGTGAELREHVRIQYDRAFPHHGGSTTVSLHLASLHLAELHNLHLWGAENESTLRGIEMDEIISLLYDNCWSVSVVFYVLWFVFAGA